MNVKKFVKQWSNRGYEKGECQPFWLSLLRDVFDIDEPENFISFEVPIPHGFIDALILSTKVLIEQKSSTVNLDDEEIFRQAKRYNDALEYSRKARWIITCNFREFRVFDMDKRFPEREPIKIALFELPNKFHALNFIVDYNLNKISVEHELSVKKFPLPHAGSKNFSDAILSWNVSKFFLRLREEFLIALNSARSSSMNNGSISL